MSEPGTKLRQAVLDAASAWLIDRHPKDLAELKLALAVVKCWPDRLDTQATCDCGDQANCDECPLSPETVISGLEREIEKRSARRASVKKGICPECVSYRMWIRLFASMA